MRTNFQATKSDYDEEEFFDQPSLEEKVYVAKGMNEDRCSHIFRRKSSTQVECVNCHMGLYDDPINPIPLEELNEYYSDKRTKEYNKWL